MTAAYQLERRRYSASGARLAHEADGMRVLVRADPAPAEADAHAFRRNGKRLAHFGADTIERGLHIGRVQVVPYHHEFVRIEQLELSDPLPLRHQRAAAVNAVGENQVEFRALESAPGVFVVLVAGEIVHAIAVGGELVFDETRGRLAQRTRHRRPFAGAALDEKAFQNRIDVLDLQADQKSAFEKIEHLEKILADGNADFEIAHRA